MIEQPEVQLSTLNSGDCFMFNGQPYIVKRTFWQNLGMLKFKIWVCRMKFDNYDWHTVGDVTVYRISRGLFDFLVQTKNKEE
ncbi:MAG: hypothetical protein RRY36_07950 [Bacteroidaceae bacterium]